MNFPSTSLRRTVLAVTNAGLLFMKAAKAMSPPSSLLDGITIPHADDVRGYITLPTEIPDHPDVKVHWKSSRPDVISDRPDGKVAPGVVHRPPPGSKPVKVKLTACLEQGHGHNRCRDYHLKVQPSVQLAEFTRYGMANFARSNSNAGQQVFFATSEANEATTWTATNNGMATL